MANGDISWITSFIWGIADDVLRDLYVRGKYRDVILPMTVLRRLDAVLEDKKQAVLERKAFLDENGIVDQDAALRDAAGQAFYNTCPFTLRDLRHRTNQAQLRDDFVAWLDGFSPSVQDIIENFEFRNQVPRLSKADALGALIEKFTHPDLNLSPHPVLNSDGTVRIPGLDNHAMGTIFEDLVRLFNEENNEEAGEHWTPRDAIKLMANLIFRPITDDIQSGTYLLYDPAIGTGGMLTVAEETLTDLAESEGKKVVTHLYGQEINSETFAICRADLLLKGEGAEADNIVGGPEYSTISNDAFRSLKFDFMMSNPPYGKSWKTDLERLGGKKDLSDPRFIVEHAGDPEFSLVPRSSDGQLLFLVNMLHKMRHDSELGSRIASVHNGSALFTGDAGSGESNIRRWIIENDWLEAIVQLPENMFYNTGITTYIWVLTNRKPPHRKGKVQLIDASRWFTPLRKSLGMKSRKFSEADIERVTRAYLAFEKSEDSKIFDNEDFGYLKITVDRPLRLRSQLSRRNVEALRFASGDEDLRSELYDHVGERLFDDFPSVAKAVEEWITTVTSDDEDENPGRKITDAQKKRLLKAETWERDAKLVEVGRKLREKIGEEVFNDHNEFRAAAEEAFRSMGEKLGSADKRALYRVVSWVDEGAPPVIKKVYPEGTQSDPLSGRFEAKVAGETRVVQYQHDPDLRDTEQVPLRDPGGVAGFIEREIWPYTPDAWVADGDGTLGYEISFSEAFYRPIKLRALELIRYEILEVERLSKEVVLTAVQELTGRE